MQKRDLKKLRKSELIKLLLKLEKKKPEIIVVDDTKPSLKPVPTPRTYKPRRPIPTPLKSVNQIVREYEDNIILPPPEFRDRPNPAPKTFKPTPKPVPAPRTFKPMPKPVPAPRTKIEQTDKALKGYTKSFEIGIKNNKDPSVQLQNTRKAVEYHIVGTLTSMKGWKFVETLKITFEKPS